MELGHVRVDDTRSYSAYLTRHKFVHEDFDRLRSCTPTIGHPSQDLCKIVALPLPANTACEARASVSLRPLHKSIFAAATKLAIASDRT